MFLVVINVNYSCRPTTITFASSEVFRNLLLVCRRGQRPSQPGGQFGVHLVLLTALGFSSPVAGHIELEDHGVMYHPVDGRGGGHGVLEDLVPLEEYRRRPGLRLFQWPAARSPDADGHQCEQENATQLHPRGGDPLDCRSLTGSDRTAAPGNGTGEPGGGVGAGELARRSSSRQELSIDVTGEQATVCPAGSPSP